MFDDSMLNEFNCLEYTYKELKQQKDVIGMDIGKSLEYTYKELKLVCVPTISFPQIEFRVYL